MTISDILLLCWLSLCFGLILISECLVHRSKNRLIAAYKDLITCYEETLESQDSNSCICKGVWQNLVSEYSPYFGRTYKTTNGDIWRFSGLLWAERDFYCTMTNPASGQVCHLSCVGSPEGHGFTLVAMEPLIEMERNDGFL